MAKVENTGGRREVHSLRPDAGGNSHFLFPGAVTVGTRKRNGVGEIPDDLLDELIEKDAFTRGLFESGECVGTSPAAAKIAARLATEAEVAQAEAKARHDAVVAAAVAKRDAAAAEAAAKSEPVKPQDEKPGA